MKLDEYGLIVSESSGGQFPGCCGDSMAETSRYWFLLDSHYELDPHTLEQFLCPLIPTYAPVPGLYFRIKWCRHPKLREQGIWANDIPTDQLLPWYCAIRWDWKVYTNLSLKDNNWRTPNGDLISPIFKAVLTPNSFWDVFIVLQALVFHIPFRWSDSTKSFESSNNSGSDILNWLVAILYKIRMGEAGWLVRLAIKLMPKQKVIDKINIAYKDEPNPIVIPLYLAVLERYWK